MWYWTFSLVTARIIPWRVQVLRSSRQIFVRNFRYRTTIAIGSDPDLWHRWSVRSIEFDIRDSCRKADETDIKLRKYSIMTFDGLEAFWTDLLKFGSAEVRLSYISIGYYWFLPTVFDDWFDVVRELWSWNKSVITLTRRRLTILRALTHKNSRILHLVYERTWSRQYFIVIYQFLWIHIIKWHYYDESLLQRIVTKGSLIRVSVVAK